MRKKNFEKIADFVKVVGFGVVFELIAMSFLGNFVYAANSDIEVEYPYYGFIEDSENPWESVYDALDEVDTVKYNDEFFEEGSSGDHPKLRAASYALALAGFENQADGYPTTSVANPKLKKFLDALGFSDYESEDIASEENGHSFGTTIGRKTLAGGKNLIVVAPRNYNYMTEWLSNFNVGTSGDHAGFSESAEFVVERLNNYIAENNLSDYKIWMVGYSRGGAVVDLTAKKINENLDDYDMEFDDFYVYTFGAPRASLTATAFSNIHDVKDGNDLLLGYFFSENWGFYNTGVYEEIHAADLEIETSAIDISKFVDSSEIMSLLSDNDGTIVYFGEERGKDFMDEWVEFVNENGLTREYFDAKIKAPLSNLMRAYQLRTLDKQGEFTDFITSIDSGLLGMVASMAFEDLTEGGYGETLEEALENFPPYQVIVKILEGSADESDISEILAYLESYMMEYDDYANFFGEEPAVTREEFYVIKENLLDLIGSIAPLLVADAKYTRENYGENVSLYYATTLVSNAENLVYGHIPESIMPILKSLISEEDSENVFGPLAPDAGGGLVEAEKDFAESDTAIVAIFSALIVSAFAGLSKVSFSGRFRNICRKTLKLGV